MSGMQLLPSKLAVPAARRFMHRDRVNRLLSRLVEYPLTVVSAGPGYGKSSAVAAALQELNVPRAWYGAGEEDASGYTFSHYLNGALETICPEAAGEPVRRLLEQEEEKARWLVAIDTLLHRLGRESEETRVLVIDDMHLVNDNPEVQAVLGRFLAHKPSWLKLVLLSRRSVAYPDILRMKAKTEVLQISTADLVFTPAEIEQYFYEFSGYRLNQEELSNLVQRTEGWIMALQLIADGVKRGVISLPLGQKPASTLETLFEFLAHEVLDKQPPEQQHFLINSAVLDELSVAACRAILGESFDEAMLSQIERTCLFTVNLGGGVYRYHHLFHDFLRRVASRQAEWQTLHKRAAVYYRNRGEVEKAVEHQIQAGDWEGAALYLSAVAGDLVRAGRFQTLDHYLKRLPRTVVEAHPELLVAEGEGLRHACRYHEAMERYEKAAGACLAGKQGKVLSLAYKGMAEIFLDTIQPVQAGIYLRKAAKALPPRHIQEKAKLVQLMAENKINQGRPRDAQRYSRLATEMLHMASRGDPDARLLLRTGRLESCVRLLLRQAGQEKGKYHPPRSFRETPLLLSLCYSFMGEEASALASAREGIRLGELMQSPFVEAVGYARLGHAYLISQTAAPEKALQSYQHALEISDRLGVVRGRTEVMMGLALYYGAHGEWAAAERYGNEGVQVADQVHDSWFAHIIRLCLGIAAAESGRESEACRYFKEAGEGLRRCSDSFGLAASRWWLAGLHLHGGWENEFKNYLRELMDLCQIHSYDFLLTRHTLLGARDSRRSIPLLQEAKRCGFRPDYAAWILERMGATENGEQPGYTLRIHTLGQFKVKRGDQEIKPREWQREKAKMLFQLLLTHRSGLMHKEQIMEALWPGAGLEAVSRDFKVALNALMNALEPDRPPRAASSYIFRQGSSYGFNLASGYWLDADEFESLYNRGLEAAESAPEQAIGFLQQAMEVYRGDYLQEVLYDEWCLAERERLAVIYLRGAELLAQLLARQGDYHGCIRWAEKILAKDNCWEEAYRLLIYCYARLNNRGLAGRIYEKCVQNLKNELGVAPSLKTTRLYLRLGRQEKFSEIL